MHGDAEGCCEDTGTSPNFTGLPFRTPFLMPWNREHVTAAFGLPHTWESGHKGQERPLQARRLTHQDGDGFWQGPAGLKAVLGLLCSMFPLQSQCSEGPARGFLALRVEDEASGHMVLHRWPGRGARFSIALYRGP